MSYYIEHKNLDVIVDNVELDYDLETGKAFVDTYELVEISRDNELLSGEEFDTVAGDLTIDDDFLDKILEAATDEEN